MDKFTYAGRKVPQIKHKPYMITDQKDTRDSKWLRIEGDNSTLNQILQGLHGNPAIESYSLVFSVLVIFIDPAINLPDFRLKLAVWLDESFGDI